MLHGVSDLIASSSSLGLAMPHLDLPDIYVKVSSCSNALVQRYTRNSSGETSRWFLCSHSLRLCLTFPLVQKRLFLIKSGGT